MPTHCSGRLRSRARSREKLGIGADVEAADVAGRGGEKYSKTLLMIDSIPRYSEEKAKDGKAIDVQPVPLNDVRGKQQRTYVA